MEKSKVSNDATDTYSDTEQPNVSTQDTEVFAAVSAQDNAAPAVSDESAVAVEPSEIKKNLDLFPVKGVEQIIARKLETVPGVVSVDSKLAGLGGRGFPRVLAQLDPVKKVAAVEAVVAVSWPSPVTEIAESCRSAIRETVTAYLGYDTTRANIVVGHAVAGKRVTSADVKARPRVSARSPHTNELRVTQPSINRKVEVVNVPLVSEPRISTVALPAEPQISTVAAPAEPDVQSIPVPTAPEVRSVTAPEPQALHAISTQEVAKLRGVEAPRAKTVHPVKTQRQRALTSVHAPAEVPVAHAKVPKPEKLAEVSYQKATVRSPHAPKQMDLKPVSTPPTRSVKVTPPEPRALKEISVEQPNPLSVDVPAPKGLREITTNATPLAEININRVAPVKHVYVPEPTPLRYISVSPENVSKQKKKG